MEQTLLSFFAAVIVAIASTLTNIGLQRRRERGAQREWESDRRYPAYVGLLSTATEFSALTTNHANLLARRSRLRPWDALVFMRTSRHVDRLHAAWAALVRHVSEVRLLATPEVVVKAEELLEVVGTSFQKVTASASSASRGTVEADHSIRIHEAVSDLRDACRRELEQADL